MFLGNDEAIDAAAKFSTSRRGGYTESEVDAFVDEVRVTVAEFTHHLNVAESARRELDNRLAAGLRPEHLDPPEDQVPVRALRLLEMAQQSADAAVADAQRSAAQLLEAAEERAGAREAAALEAVRAVEESGRQQEERIEAATELLRTTEAETRARVQQLAERLASVLDARSSSDVAVQP